MKKYLFVSIIILLFACKKGSSNNSQGSGSNIDGHWKLQNMWSIDYSNNILGDTLNPANIYTHDSSFIEFTSSGSFHYFITNTLELPNDTIVYPNYDYVGNYSLPTNASVNLNYNDNGENKNYLMDIIQIDAHNLTLLYKTYSSNIISNKLFYVLIK